MATTLTPSRPQSSTPARDSFSLFRKELDDLVSSFWNGNNTNWFPNPYSPALDVVEAENAFMVKMDIPGMEAKDIDIQVHANTLTLSGQRKEEKEVKGKNQYRMERQVGSFSRTITLPCAVNEDEVAAEYTNGVLTLTLPKCEKAKTKRIAVKG